MNQRIVITRPGKVELVDCEMPTVKPGEALLKVLYGGICGSDLNSYRGASPYVTYPRTPGHEFSAEIVSISEPADSLKPGMLVTANPYFNCGVYYSCKRGLVNCCTTNQTMGVQREGAFTQYLTMPIDRLYAGNDLDARTLALVEPFCIAYHGVKHASPCCGERVLVMGAGTIGLLAAMVAKRMGAFVTVCDVSREKVDNALRFGVDDGFVNQTSIDFQTQVDRLTASNGFDVVIEAVGLPQTFQRCIDAATFGARMVLIGVGKDPLDFDFTIIQKKELVVQGSRNAVKADFEEVIAQVNTSGVDLLKLVTHEYKMRNCVQAFEDLHQNAAKTLKVLIDFT